MKSIFRIKNAILLLLALALALCSVPALAAAKPAAEPEYDALIYPSAFGRTRIRMAENGEYKLDKKASFAKPGENEYFAVALMASESAASGERATVTVRSAQYDFSKCEPVLLVPVDNVYYVMNIADYEAAKESVSAVVSVEYLGVNSSSPVYLHVSGVKLEANAKVFATVEREIKQRLDYGESIYVGGYSIRKQGGLLPSELAIGMSGMDDNDTVYIVSDLNGKELIRLVIQDGRLIGIGKKDGEVVIGLEYDVDSRYYVSSLTHKKLMDRDTVNSIFKALDISFAKDPDESSWLREQGTYKTKLGILIK